jgi:hypothetical protein
MESVQQDKGQKKPTPNPQPVVQPHYEWQVGLYEPVRYQRQQDFLKAALDYHAAHCLSAEVKGEATHAAD